MLKRPTLGLAFNHHRLGRCRVDALCPDGSIRVITASVNGRGKVQTNVFTLARPPADDPSNWDYQAD